MKLKVFLQHSSARKTNRYTPYKEWVIPRLDYWTARVRNYAPVPKYDTTLEKWVFEPLGDTDKTNREIKRPLIVPKQRIRLSPWKETLGLRLLSENQATKSYTEAAERPSCPRLSEHESDSECQTSGELDPYAYFVDEFEKAKKNYTAAEGPNCPTLSEYESDSECQTSGELDPYVYFADKFEKARKNYTAAEGPNCPTLSEYESDSECQTSGELDPYAYFVDEFEKARKNYTAAEGPNCPRLSEHESDSECQTSGELDPYVYFADKFEKARKNYTAAEGPNCPRLSGYESDSECQTSGELDPYAYFVDEFEKARKNYTAAEGPKCPRLSEHESDSECQTSGELDPYAYLADKFEKARKNYTAAEGPNCPRLSEYESDSECQTSGELDPYAYFADKFEKAMKKRGQRDDRSEPEESKTRHELEGNLTDDDERTVASPVNGEDPMWWYPSPDALDFLFTHSSPDEFGRKYRTWSELETSEGQNSPNTSSGDSYIPTDQSLWYAKNVLATGRDIIYRPTMEDWREQMDEWSHMTRLINECETQSLIPTLQFRTHTCEWLARVDFRHESVRQKIDYTRPRPKSLREKPGFCARHRPYVRKTRNHREALAKAGHMDLSRVQFIDNY
uniref:Uncharacterized protein LOC111122126 n=1 Tax=Crassostrea virginica TaxID=6565 RepID=A0A8B8CU83_CRAVI|nr:uncharacterized protein LOC111122126 [Crassostrea virginica]